ncbi:MAG: hypothetical protein ACYS26_04185 [Planctomycetota bacterium]|jgi:chromate transport protein ChrA
MVDPAPRGSRASLALGLLCAGVALAVLVLARQPRAFGDGPLLVFSYGLGNRTHHLLYGPWLELLSGWVGDVREAAHWASALPVAAAVGLLAGVLRARGSAVPAALWAAAAVLLSPAVLFFGTTIEVHGLQLLGGTLGWLMLTASSSKSAPRALGIGVLGLLALGGTHPAHLPALVLFGAGRAWIERRGSCRPFVPWALSLLGLLAFAGLLWSYLDHNRLEAEDTRSLAFGAHSFAAAWNWGLVDWGVLGTLGWLGALVLARRGGADRERALLALAWFGAMLSLPLAIHLDERGGYLISMAPALAALTVRAAEGFRAGRRRLLAAAGVVLLLTQGLRTAEDWRGFNAPPAPATLEILRELESHTGGEGVFLSASPGFEKLVAEWSTVFAPGYLYRAAGAPPEGTAQLLPHALDWLTACTRRGQRVYLVNEGPLDPEVHRATRPGLAEALERLDERFAIAALPGVTVGGLPLFELTPR